MVYINFSQKDFLEKNAECSTATKSNFGGE